MIWLNHESIVPVRTAQGRSPRPDDGRRRLPLLVACQKRSGLPFGGAAYWPHAEVLIEGEARQFDRPTDLGGVVSQFLCPDCGTTEYMSGTKNPTVTGVPIGLFDDAHSMQPIRSV